jgi:branched-chain amino acid transport system ATP-binding protein
MLLEASQIRSGYATGDVLQGVSIAVSPGEIVGVLGRNGVGKTTLLRTLIGLLPARSGSVLLHGRDVTGERAHRRARRGIGYVPQGREIFPDMSVIDNLRMGQFIGRTKDATGHSTDFDLAFSYFPFLEQRKAQRGSTLSGGQQEMLAIARALVNRPEILLLDEPSDGVQPNIVDAIGDAILGLNAERKLTVLVVEQNVDLVQKIVDRAYILDKGRVVRVLGAEDIRNTSRLAEFLAI